MLDDLKDRFLKLIGRGFAHELQEAEGVVKAGLKGCRSIRRHLNQALDVVNALGRASDEEKEILLKRYGHVLASIDESASGARYAGTSLIDGRGFSLALNDGRKMAWTRQVEHLPMTSGSAGLDLPQVSELDNQPVLCEEAQARIAGTMKHANQVYVVLTDHKKAIESRMAQGHAPEEESGKKEKGDTREAAVEISQIVVIALALALVFRTFFFQPFNIPSGSMKPTLLVGDYLFVSKYSYGYSHKSFPFGIDFFDGRILQRAPKRGDVIVFKLTADGHTDYIKRLVGLPGDRVQVLDGWLYVNDDPVSRASKEDYWYTDERSGRQMFVPQFEETLPGGKSHRTLDLTSIGSLDNTSLFVVPEGHYFFMGDNRDDSWDSRAPGGDVGMVPAENIVGKAQLIFVSVDGSARVWQVWKWPFAIRYSRLLQKIK